MNSALFAEGDRASALQDVRRAYRLVWAHQRRMLDMVEAITRAFPETIHYWWDPMLFETLKRRDSDPIGRWAWDSLPYYEVSWLRVVETANKRHRPLPGAWMLQITHQADTGWDDDGKPADEPDARRFAPARECRSELSIGLWKSEIDVKGEGWWNWHKAWWSYPDYPEDDEGPKPTDPATGLRGIIITRDMAELASVEDVAAMANEARRRGREELGIDLPDLGTRSG